MPVVSPRSSRSQQLSLAAAFLDRWQRVAQQNHRPQLVSLSFDIPLLDPLVVLDRLVPKGDRHLYLETPSTQTSVVGFGTALTYEASGSRRFAQARRFIDRWRSQIRRHSEAGSAAGAADWARFFCTFTFFAEGTASLPAAMVMLPRWQLVRQGDRGVLTFNHLLVAGTATGPLLEELDQQLGAIGRLSLTTSPNSLITVPRTVRPSPEAGQQFKAAVQRALGHMAQHPVEKIVLAHALDWASPQPLQPVASLGRLRQRYPNCHVFSLGQGDGTTFIGASPERLLSVVQGHLVTDALAGSAPRGSSPLEDRVLAQDLLQNPKEQGEHRLVVEFLARQLRQVGLHPHYPARPRVRQLSNIQHLHTPMRARVPASVHSLHVVEALHPTPAVAGVPTQAACDQILKFETFDRGLYAAPLGWVGANGDSEFIVGIRSALIGDFWARLYAGAGIVAGSDPDREWAEIQLKFRALGESLV